MNGDDRLVALLEAAAGPTDGLAELAVGGVPVRGERDAAASASSPRRGG